MLQPPLEQEIVLKYQTLPSPLRDALESRYGLKRIREIAKRHSLIEEDVEVVVQLTGLSMLGFLNPRDLAQELSNYLELRDEKTIDALAGELIREVLAPLKSDLQNLYRTPDIFLKAAEKPAPQPEARASETKEMPAPAAETRPVEQPVPIRKEGAGAPGPVSLEALRAAPEPMMPLRPAEPVPAKIHPFALGETPVKPAAPSAPFMLRKEEVFAPIMESKPVQIQRSAAPRPEAGKATAVRLEMAGLEEEKKKKEEVVAKTEMPQQRVVHYSAFRTPVNPFGGEPAKEQATAPAAPMRQAAPPVPPVPAAPKPKEEVIDLSTFQRAPASPKLDGNTVDLRN